MTWIILTLYCFLLSLPCALAASTVSVIFHIFYDQKAGNSPDGVLSEQMHVLNFHYQSMGLQFHITNVQRIPVSSDILHDWAPDNNHAKFIQGHRSGNVGTLNIYTLGQSRTYSSFFASPPHDYQSNPQADGIIIPYDNLPGGSSVGYNTGKVLATAVGRWSGLYPTSQNGCHGPGDFVDDTPAEASPATGCPVGRNSCPGPGTDPIHNMMDSTSDSCRTHFTVGQSNRVRQQLQVYRGIGF